VNGQLQACDSVRVQTSPADNNPFANFFWFRDGTQLDPANNPIARGNNADFWVLVGEGGEYVVVLEETYVTTGLTCSDTDTVIVVPVASPEIFGPNEVCAGIPMTYTSNVAGQWSVTGPADFLLIPPISATTELLFNANPFGSDSTVVLRIELDNALACSTEFEINVLPQPGFTLGPVTFCEADVVTVDAADSLAGLNIVEYVWTNALGQPTTGSALSTDTPARWALRVTDANGCVYEDSVAFQQLERAILGLSMTDTACYGGSAMIVAAVQNESALVNGGRYVFTNNSGFQVVQESNILDITALRGDSLYSVVYAALGCTSEVFNYAARLATTPEADFTASPEMPVTIKQPNLNVEFNSTTQFFYGTGQAQPNAPAGSTVNYVWNILPTGETLTGQNAAFTFPDRVQVYDVQLLVEARTGTRVCRDSVTRSSIIVEVDDFLFIPNVFTPNGDGVNNTFIARGEGLRNIKVSIFDRWGRLMASKNLDVPATGQVDLWDGTINGNPAAEGVYFYSVEYTTLRDIKGTRNGQVTLLR
jgi:gliding motility-associated-like protein